MSRLKKIEIYAINWLNAQKLSPENIANELNLKVDQVKKTLEKNQVARSEESEIKTHSQPVNNSKSKDLMITSTSVKKNKNVSIMTKEASEYNDAVKKNTSPSSRNNSGIFITRPND